MAKDRLRIEAGIAWCGALERWIAEGRGIADRIYTIDTIYRTRPDCLGMALGTVRETRGRTIHSRLYMKYSVCPNICLRLLHESLR